MEIWLSYTILNLDDSKTFSKEGASSFYKVSVPHTVLLGSIINLSVAPLFYNLSSTHKM